MTRRGLAALFFVASLLPLGCRPPAAVVLIDDPAGIAGDADTLRFGRSLDDMAVKALDRALPVTVTVTADEVGERLVFIEALRGDTVVARAHPLLSFLLGDGSTKLVALALACDPSAADACDNGLFCDGVEACDPISWTCTAGTTPCALELPACAVPECTEETATCGAIPDHRACEPVSTASGDVPSFCDVDAGCVATIACEVAADCDDDVFCNGAESCLEGRCLPGTAPVIDDEEACTDDTCDENTGAVVHTPRVRGSLCELADEAPGVCLTGTCVSSRCGDGVLDLRTGEVCDDDNTHDEDLCTAACQPAEFTLERFAGGSLCDDGPLADAYLPSIHGMAAAPDGTLVFLHRHPASIRRFDPATGIITRVAGNLVGGHDEDGVDALQSRLELTGQLAIHPTDGRVFFREHYPNRVRAIEADGTIGTVAGVPDDSSSADDTDALLTRLDESGPLAFLPDGSLLIGYRDWDVVRRMQTPVGGPYPIEIIVGGGSGWTPGGPALDLALDLVTGLAALPDGTFLSTTRGDLDNLVAQHTFSVADGAWLTTPVVGTGTCGALLPPGDALLQDVCTPEHIAVGALGSPYCFVTNRQLACVDAGGVLDIVAGNGGTGTPDLDVPATASPLGDVIEAIAADDGGRLYLSIYDEGSSVRLLRLSALGGNLEDLHPSSVSECGLDGPARDAHFKAPTHLALLPGGTLGFAGGETIYNVDADDVVRHNERSGAERVAWSPSGELAVAYYSSLRLEYVDSEGNPKLRTFAGGGTDHSDDILAEDAYVGRAADLLWVDDNTLLFADEPEQKIRRLRRANDVWTVDTVAGTGVPDPLAGAGPALATPLYFAFDLVARPDGTIFFAQRDDPRLHRVTPGGEREVVTTLPAPITAIAALPSGTLYVALNSRHIVALIAEEDGSIASGAQAVPVIGDGTDNRREGPASEVPLSEVRYLVTTPAGDVFATGGKKSQMIFRLRRAVAP